VCGEVQQHHVRPVVGHGDPLDGRQGTAEGEVPVVERHPDVVVELHFVLLGSNSS
jgi:hypothetical protein